MTLDCQNSYKKNHLTPAFDPVRKDLHSLLNNVSSDKSSGDVSTNKVIGQVTEGASNQIGQETGASSILIGQKPEFVANFISQESEAKSALKNLKDRNQRVHQF